MYTLKCFRVLTLTACILAISLLAAGQTGQFTTIDYPEALHTFALGNNPAGDVVGAYVDTEYNEHAFVLRNGSFTSFDWPDALWTDAFGINPRGDIVGQYGWFDGVNYITRGFLLRDGVFYPLDMAGHQNTMPFKISAKGTIVGCNHHSTSFAGGTDLNSMVGFSVDALGNTENTLARSMNTGVNPSGDIVGYFFGTSIGTASGRAEWSYVIHEGVMSWFQYPGAFATLATDINPDGAIVGRYRLQTPATFHGFVLRDGEFSSFDAPGATNTLPFGVNAGGDIVGYYQVGSGSSAVNHGFVIEAPEE